MKPVQFGTDGWRGVMAADFTFERVEQVAAVAAQVLVEVYGGDREPVVAVGFDRRFLSEKFAQRAAQAIAEQGIGVRLADRFAPTPALSWAAWAGGGVGAIVITASHNPPEYNGLKIKGAFGGSVPVTVTQAVEARLAQGAIEGSQTRGALATFNPWPDYLEALRGKVDLAAIQDAVQSGRLRVWTDPMHGAAAGGLGQLLALPDTPYLQEIRGQANAWFGGHPPEPLAAYLQPLLQAMRAGEGELRVGLAFDGDGDRIAAADGEGNYLNSQVLIPILIDHLAGKRGLRGELIKTISGSDFMPQVAARHGLPTWETHVGYKYIAERMLTNQAQGQSTLLGGEESGGIGYGSHIPERDALLSALYLLEAVALSGEDLGQYYRRLQRELRFDRVYDRRDVRLPNAEARAQVETRLAQAPLTEIAGAAVTGVRSGDGYKFRLADGDWAMVRFSGTEPLLRLYVEAATGDRVAEVLAWLGQELAPPPAVPN
ncbi:MAG: phosphoglucomutase/phosphomannomutase family protein [Oscillatoriales cyanobacterium SM2_1_8]|nr:phosphoglucomutase/phosphomannomutase family protein [Oscillatoriales cyanobacterium SM2_1_8]